MELACEILYVIVIDPSRVLRRRRPGSVVDRCIGSSRHSLLVVGHFAECLLTWPRLLRLSLLSLTVGTNRLLSVIASSAGQEAKERQNDVRALLLVCPHCLRAFRFLREPIVFAVVFGALHVVVCWHESSA